MLISCLWLCGWSQVFAAPVLELNGDRIEQLQLGTWLSLYHDPTAQLSLEQLTQAPYADAFMPQTRGIISKGYMAKGVFWARLSIRNTSEAPLPLHIVSRYATLDKLSLYEVKESFEPITLWVLGDLVRASERPIQHRLPIFPLEIEPGLHHYYFKMETTSAVIFALEAWTPKAFVDSELAEQLFYGSILGICIVMFFYNLFVYFKFSQRAYLFYCSYIFSYLCFFALYNGLASIYVAPDAVGSWWMRDGIYVVIDCISLTAVAFSIAFLNLKDTHKRIFRFYRILQGLCLVNIANWLLFSSSFFALQFTLAMSFGLSCILIGVGFYRMFRFRPARFYVLAWTFIMLGNIVTLLANNAAIPSTGWVPWLQPLGAAAELVLLSLALGEKFALLQAEREASLQEQQRLQAIAFEAEKSSREATQRSLDEQKRLNEQRDQLVANTSHELRTPLNGMMGLAQAIQRREQGNLTPDSLRSLDGIIRSGQRLAALLGDLLDFSRGERQVMSLYPAPTSLNDQINLVFDILRPTLGEDPIELVNLVGADDVIVHADPDRLQQILFNLVSNAIKFTSKGKIKVSALVQGDIVTVRVSDSGNGIDAADHERIFTAFTQADGGIARRHGGLGLGLAIVKQIVEAHGGVVGVQSVPNFGSTFWFTLSLNQAPEPSLSRPDQKLMVDRKVSFESQLESARRGNSGLAPITKISGWADQDQLHASLDILIVDDEPMNRQVLEEILRMSGHRTQGVGDGPTALDLIRNKSKFDVILLDIMMPEMSGYDVLRHLRQEYNEAELPVIVLSAKALEKDLLAAYALGASDYILKPFSATEVDARLHHQARLKAAIEKNLHIQNESLQLRDALKSVEEQLQHAERLASMGAATAGIAHELSNPLLHFKTLMEWLRQGIESSMNAAEPQAKILGYCDLADRTVQTMLGMTESIKAVMRHQPQDAARYEVDRIVEDVVNILHHKLKYFHFSKDVEPGLWFKGRRSDLVQVLMNLLSNAADAVKGRKDDRIHLTIRQSDQKLILKVEDSGAGIPTMMREKIFEPFYTTKDLGQGTGLGLAVVKSITQRLDAELQITDSENYGGASFTISMRAA
ncbi:ATP-binding protein [Oligoflexus tunisiensis]|uniref:ATP-binding protein n=1 Tax=Oligoflexus tunisiensis TaxID=708132 RepID=UPI001C4020FB|nr:ATP-binding protein [Oligoflexus tunisiensis]